MSSGMTAYSCTPRQVKKHLIRCMIAGLVPFIQSSPAMGKSSLTQEVADEFNLQLLDLRLSTMAPEDLSGLPHFSDKGTATFAPFDTFPIESTPIPEGKQGWMIFLDEFNSASKAVQAAAYKLVLDRMTGLHKLHKKVVIVCAGNLSTDRAITNPISTAMQSRLVHLKMELNHQEFMEDVALKHNWDKRIVSFLYYKPTLLHDFRPDHNENTFCSPRTWEFMNKLIKGHEVENSDAALYAGTITSGVALDFINFVKVYDSLPKLADIIKDPENTDLPVDAPTRFATIGYLTEYVTDENFDKLATYINRLTSEFRVLFFRSLIIQKPALRKHQAFRQAMVELSRYLHDDIDQAAA